VFSPDGKSIAFVRGIQSASRVTREGPDAVNDQDGQPPKGYHVYTLSFDNGKTGRPTQITAEHSYGRARLYFSPFDDHISPNWSPDGKELLLISNRGIPLGSGAIWRAPVEPNAMAKAKMILRKRRCIARSLSGRRTVSVCSTVRIADRSSTISTSCQSTVASHIR
jgi:hypothetical protein